jgi:general secretion pathway protein I
MNKSMKTSARSGEDRSGDVGFTLIEVLVALTILSISLAVLMQLIGGNLARLRASTAEATAISLSQSLLDQLGTSIPLRLGDHLGDFGKGFHWRVRVEPYGSAADPRAHPVRGVVLTVWTMWDGERKSVSLTALRLIASDQ